MKAPSGRAASRLLAALVIAGPLALALGCAEELEPQRDLEFPRVLLLTVDTLRPDYLSANGHPLPTTPFLDSLMAEATVFENALSPIPRTTQALASFLTGTYPHTHDVRSLFDSLDERLPTLGELASEAGYRTVAVISNHVLEPARGLGRGFEVYDFASDARDAAATTRAAMQRAEAIAPEEPLLLWVHYIDPHVPYQPPPALARSFSGDYAGPYASHFGGVAGSVGESAYPPELGKKGAVYENRLSSEVNAQVRRLYAADIRATDDAIRLLVEVLRARPGPEWLVVLTSDHGENLGEHDYFYDHGDYVYGPSLRVPLAVVLPSGHPLHGARRIEEWVSLVDVLPTLVDLMGLTLGDAERRALDGRSLLPALRGEPLARRPVFAESGQSFYPKSVRRRVSFDISGRFRTVIDGRWKLDWTPGLPPGSAFELYDLVEDPGETRDLNTPGHPEVARLRALLRDWMRPNERERREPRAEDLRALRELGYVE